MPRPRSAMRKIREILRLALGEGLSRRQAAAATGLPYTTVADHLARAAAGRPRLAAARRAWTTPQLEARLFAPAAAAATGRARPLPDWPTVHRELRRKGVTLQLLLARIPGAPPRRASGTPSSASPTDAGQGRPRPGHAPGAPRRREALRRLRRADHPHHRPRHRRGLAGPAVRGRPRRQQLHLCRGPALPGAAALDRRPRPRLRGFIGGCARLIVPDNLRSGVTRAHRYEPEHQPHLRRDGRPLRLCGHPGSAVQASGQGEGRDTACCSPSAGCWPPCATARSSASPRPTPRSPSGWPGSTRGRSGSCPGRRQSLFAELDRPALRPLPARPYEYADWKTAKVNIDYHVEVDRHWYSVPYQLVGQRCDIRVTAGDRRGPPSGPAGGQPPRAGTSGGASPPMPAHMPEAHRRHAEWTPGPDRRLGRADRTRDRPTWWRVIMASPAPSRAGLPLAASGSCAWAAATATSASRRRRPGPSPSGALSYRSVESILRSRPRRPAPAR